MREAFATVTAAAFVALALGAAAGAPGGGASGVVGALDEALRELEAGRGPAWSRVVVVDASGASEREATRDEARGILEEARARVLAGGAPPAGDSEYDADVGFGSRLLGLPHEGCTPVETRLYAVTQFSERNMLEFRTGLPAPPPIREPMCQMYSSLPIEVLLNATLALETCGTCAVASAQVWARAPPGSSHVNDFRYAQHRGFGSVYGVELCFTWICTQIARFEGAHATSELLWAPPVISRPDGVPPQP